MSAPSAAVSLASHLNINFVASEYNDEVHEFNIKMQDIYDFDIAWRPIMGEQIRQLFLQTDVDQLPKRIIMSRYSDGRKPYKTFITEDEFQLMQNALFEIFCELVKKGADETIILVYPVCDVPEGNAWETLINCYNGSANWFRNIIDFCKSVPGFSTSLKYLRYSRYNELAAPVAAIFEAYAGYIVTKHVKSDASKVNFLDILAEFYHAALDRANFTRHDKLAFIDMLI